MKLSKFSHVMEFALTSGTIVKEHTEKVYERAKRMDVFCLGSKEGSQDIISAPIRLYIDFSAIMNVVILCCLGCSFTDICFIPSRALAPHNKLSFSCLLFPSETTTGSGERNGIGV